MNQIDIDNIEKKYLIIDAEVKAKIPSITRRINAMYNSTKNFRNGKGVKFVESKNFFDITPDYYLLYKSDNGRIMARLLFPVKTPKGTLYVLISNVEKITFCVYTAHFFDRYNQRLNKSLNRTEIIKNFLLEMLNNFGIANDNENVIIELNNGIGLGEIINDKITFVKTFVDNSILTENQIDVQKELNTQSKAFKEFIKLKSISSTLDVNIISEDEIMNHEYTKKAQPN